MSDEGFANGEVLDAADPNSAVVGVDILSGAGNDVGQEAAEPSPPPAVETDASVVDDGDGSTPEPEPSSDAGAYVPADHTVEQVVEYAAAHPDQLDAIVAAERAGKARSTLLAALGAPLLAEAS